jgi:hypothetical protein
MPGRLRFSFIVGWPIGAIGRVERNASVGGCREVDMILPYPMLYAAIALSKTPTKFGDRPSLLPSGGLPLACGSGERILLRNTRVNRRRSIRRMLNG